MREASHHLQVTPPVILLPMQSILHFSDSLEGEIYIKGLTKVLSAKPRLALISFVQP